MTYNPKLFEKTCTCIKEYKIDNLVFHVRREYQVDIYPLYYKVYQNGTYNDYVFLNEDEFNEYFKEIV